MPKELHDKLKKRAEQKFPGDKERQDKYIYGTLAKIEKAQNHPWYRKVGKKKA